MDSREYELMMGAFRALWLRCPDRLRAAVAAFPDPAPGPVAELRAAGAAWLEAQTDGTRAALDAALGAYTRAVAPAPRPAARPASARTGAADMAAKDWAAADMAALAGPEPDWTRRADLQ